MIRRLLLVGSISFALSMVLFYDATVVGAQEPRKGFHKDEVSAAFLYNLISFTTWPNQPQVTILCLNGTEEHLYKTLDAIAKDRSKIRKVTVKNEISDPILHGCHILYFGEKSNSQTRDILTKIQKESILTVGEDDLFLQNRGIIRFVFSDANMKMQISIKSLERSGIKLSSFLLNVVQKVDK